MYNCIQFKQNRKTMKKIILVLATIFSFGVANAQVDVITKHSGETVEGKVIN